MANFAVICNGSLKDYIINCFSQHPNYKISCFVSYSTPSDESYRGIPEKTFSSLSPDDFDNVLIAQRDSYLGLGIAEKLIAQKDSFKELKKIYFLKSYLFRTGDNFFLEDSFNPRCVISVEIDDNTIEKIYELFSISFKVDPAKKYAENTVKTKDGITASKLKDLYVKFNDDGHQSRQTVGLTFLDDKTIISDCFNGKHRFYKFTYSNLFFDTHYDVVINEQTCVLTRYCSDWNYAHFYVEVCDKILIAEELGFNGKYLLFHNRDAEALMTLLHIDLSRIIWVELSDFGKTYLIRDAFEIDGFGFKDNLDLGLKRLIPFSLNIAKSISLNQERKYPKRIYIKRYSSRKLLNIDYLLDKYGFTTILPEDLSLEDEIKYFYNADIVLCPHGAALTNVLFMKDHSTLIETCPHDFQVIEHRPYIFKKKINYFVLVEPKDMNYKEKITGEYRNYSVDNGHLEYILQELTGS